MIFGIFHEHSDTAHVTWVGPWNSGRPEPRTKAGDSPNVWGHRVSATWWPPTYEANSGSSMRPTESLKCNTNNKENIWNHYFFPNFWTKRSLSDFIAALRLCMIAFTWLQASLLGAFTVQVMNPTWDGLGIRELANSKKSQRRFFKQCLSDLLPSKKSLVSGYQTSVCPPQKAFFSGVPHVRFLLSTWTFIGDRYLW